MTGNTEFITLYKKGDWIVGYYTRIGDPNINPADFLNIYNTRTGNTYELDHLVPGHIKSKYIFWKNMLVE